MGGAAVFCFSCLGSGWSRNDGGSVDCLLLCFFFSSRRRHTRLTCDWSSDVCSSDLEIKIKAKTVVKFHYFAGAIASFAALATRNFTTVLALILISSPVCGLRPMRALRCRSEERRVGKEGRSRGSAYDWKASKGCRER